VKKSCIRATALHSVSLLKLPEPTRREGEWLLLGDQHVCWKSQFAFRYQAFWTHLIDGNNFRSVDRSDLTLYHNELANYFAANCLTFGERHFFHLPFSFPASHCASLV
jgi:hypothetical protein